MFHMLITAMSLIFNFFDIIQVRCSMDIFKDYFETPLLFQFIYMKFCIFSFEFFHYVNISNKAFRLDFNLFIIYNFYFVIVNGNFF